MTLKLYGITIGSTEFPTDSLIAASKEVARQSIGDIFEPSASDTAFPYGFLGIHQGDGFNFVFLCWWANRNEMMQGSFVCPSGTTIVLKPYEGDMIACTYDMAVMSFERDAFVRHVLGRDAPDWKA